MKISRVCRAFRTYGVVHVLGKALLALVMLSAPLRASEITVLALGDSLTQGYGLVQDEGLVPQLQGWLEAREADVQVINAGVSGDTTAGGAARAAWSLTEDVDAMIVTLGGNDLLRGIDPAVSRENLEVILQAAEAQDVPVLLVGLRAPSNYGPAYEAAFNAMYPDLAEAYETLLHPDFFSGLGDGTPESWRPYFQPDRIHPNAEGIALIVEDLGPSVLNLLERVTP